MDKLHLPGEKPQGIFPLGEVYITRGIYEDATRDIQAAIARHAFGDWGEVVPEDREENELSLKESKRIISVYRTRAGIKFWVITEADRSSTTVLFPDEY